MTSRGSVGILDDLVSDARYALRGLIQKPGFTVAVILTLALGIGANAVVFARVHAVILRPQPYPNADRIISVSQIDQEGRDNRVLHEVPYATWAQSARTADAVAAYEETQGVLNLPNGSLRVTGLRAPPAYFGISGVRLLMGRTFEESEALPGVPPSTPVRLLSISGWSKLATTQ